MVNANPTVNGEATLALDKGNIIIESRSSRTFLRRSDCQNGSGRIVQSDGRRKIPAHQGAAGPSAGARDAAKVLTWRTTRRVDGGFRSGPDGADTQRPPDGVPVPRFVYCATR